MHLRSAKKGKRLATPGHAGHGLAGGGMPFAASARPASADQSGEGAFLDPASRLHFQAVRGGALHVCKSATPHLPCRPLAELKEAVVDASAGVSGRRRCQSHRVYVINDDNRRAGNPIGDEGSHAFLEGLQANWLQGAMMTKAPLQARWCLSRIRADSRTCG